MSDVTVLLRTVAGNDRSATTRCHAACRRLQTGGRIDSRGHLIASLWLKR